jgi:hypothetical protein
MKILNVLLLSAALGTTSMFAQTTAVVTPTPTPKPTTPVVSVSKLPDSVKTLVAAFVANRTQLVAARQAALVQFKTATAEEKKLIIQTLVAEQKKLLTDNVALKKDIQAAMKTLRDQRKTTTPGG